MSLVRCEEGVSTRERIAVTSDALDIVKRLKEIDEDFFVMLNRQTQRFEVHVRGQEETLGCELPFDMLDARTIEYVQEHRAGRMREIMRRMELQEMEREAERARRFNELNERAADGFAYLKDKRTTDEFPDEVLEGLDDDASGDVRGGSRIHRPQRRLCNHHG